MLVREKAAMATTTYMSPSTNVVVAAAAGPGGRADVVMVIEACRRLFNCGAAL
jgi:hypothetical protein